MVLIFLKVLMVFTVSSFEFHKSHCLDFIANDEWPQFTQPQSTTRLSGLGEMLESLQKLQQKPTPVPEF